MPKRETQKQQNKSRAPRANLRTKREEEEERARARRPAPSATPINRNRFDARAGRSLRNASVNEWNYGRGRDNKDERQTEEPRSKVGELWQGAKDLYASKKESGRRANEITAAVPDNLTRTHLDISDLTNNRGMLPTQVQSLGYDLDAGKQQTEEQRNRRMAADAFGRALLVGGEKYLPGLTLDIPERLGRRLAAASGQEYNLGGIAGLTAEETQDVRNSLSGTIGGFGGQMAGYMTASGLASGALQGTALGQKALNNPISNWLKKQPLLKDAITRGLAKQGIKATEDMVAEKAGEFVTRLGIDLMTDIPMGIVQSHNQMLNDGIEFGSDEYWKGMAWNTGLDVGAGSIMNAGPVLWNVAGNLNPLTRSTDEILSSRAARQAAGDALENTTRAARASEMPDELLEPIDQMRRRYNAQYEAGLIDEETLRERLMDLDEENAERLLTATRGTRAARASEMPDVKQGDLPSRSGRSALNVTDDQIDNVLRTLDNKRAIDLNNTIYNSDLHRSAVTSATNAQGEREAAKAYSRIRKLLTKNEITNGMNAAEVDDLTERVLQRARGNLEAGDIRGADYSFDAVRNRLRAVDRFDVDKFIGNMDRKTVQQIENASPRKALDLLEEQARKMPRPEKITDEAYEQLIQDRVRMGYDSLHEKSTRIKQQPAPGKVTFGDESVRQADGIVAEVDEIADDVAEAVSEAPPGTSRQPFVRRERAPEEIVDIADQRIKPEEAEYQVKQLLNEEGRFRGYGAQKASPETEKRTLGAIDEMTAMIRDGRFEDAALYAHNISPSLLSEIDTDRVVNSLDDILQEEGAGKRIHDFLHRTPLYVDDVTRRGIPDGYPRWAKQNGWKNGGLYLVGPNHGKRRGLDQVYESLMEEYNLKYVDRFAGAETGDEILEKITDILELSKGKNTIPLEPDELAYMQGEFADELLNTAYRNAETIDSVLGIGPERPGMTGNLSNDVIDYSGVREEGYSSTVGYHKNKAIDTMMNSDKISEDTKELLGFLQDPTEHRSNAISLENGRKRVADWGGADKAYKKWNEFIGSNTRAKSDDYYAGIALWEELENAGKRGEAENVLSDLANMSSESGRMLQAIKFFRKLSPAGQEDAIRNMAKTLARNTGADLEVSQELIDMFRNARTARQREMAIEAIRTDLWNQVPLTLGERLRSFRYLAMLGNPKTHIRNIAANVIYWPVRQMDNAFTSAMEKALPKEMRTRSVLPGKHWNELTETGQLYLDAARGNMGSRWDAAVSVRPGDARHLNSDILQNASNVVGKSLEAGDQVFSDAEFTRQFAGILQAQGYTPNTLTREAADWAADLAGRRAAEATYRNANFISQALNKLGQAGPLGRFFVDTMTPFTKTPSNILIQSWNHSPMGVLQGMGRLLTANGNRDAVQKALSQMGQGLTGTGLLMLGVGLGKAGIITGNIDSTTTEGKFREMLGEQDYSVKIGNNTFKLDWAAPDSIPIFVGAELANRMGEEFSLKDIAGIAEGFYDMLNPVFDQSMLSGLENALDTSSRRDIPATLAVAENMVQNYANQFFPTLGRQINQTFEKEKKTSRSTAESPFEREWEGFFKQTEYRIPGLNKLLEPYVNNLGERETKETAGDYAMSALQNFISPGKITTLRDEPVTNELSRLAGRVDGTEARKLMPPGTKDYDVKVNGEKVRMTESELTTFMEERGQYAREQINKLFNSAEYKSMNDAEKVKAIDNIYSDALHHAQDQFALRHGATQVDVDFGRLSGQTQAKFNPRTMDKGTFVTLYNSTKPYGTNNGKMVAAAEAGLSYDALGYLYDMDKERYFMAQYAVQQGLTASQVESIARGCDADGNGSLKKSEITDYLDSQNLTREQKMVLFDMLSQSKKNPYR